MPAWRSLIKGKESTLVHQHRYLIKLAETYFNEEIKLEELLEYVKDVNMEEAVYTQVIAKFNELRVSLYITQAKIKKLKESKPTPV